MKLLVPSVLEDEVARHIPATPKRSIDSLQTRLREFREITRRFFDQDAIATLVPALDGIAEHLKSVPSVLLQRATRINRLLKSGSSIDVSQLYEKVIERALEKGRHSTNT